MRKFGAKLLEVLRKGDMVLLALCVLTSVFGIVMVAASTAYDGSSRYVIIQTESFVHFRFRMESQRLQERLDHLLLIP